MMQDDWHGKLNRYTLSCQKLLSATEHQSRTDPAICAGMCFSDSSNTLALRWEMTVSMTWFFLTFSYLKNYFVFKMCKLKKDAS